MNDRTVVTELVLAAVLLQLFCVVCTTQDPLEETSDGPGLSVSENGRLLLDGEPYRGIGVNYWDAFSRTLEDPEATGYRKGFEQLKEAGIPFARIMGCGFWPDNWSLYLKNKKQYFKRMDGVARAAEQQKIGLIINLFWHASTVPDLVGEPVNQWGNPDSDTISFMREYVRDVVRRYRDSPAVWGWEFGNEYNLNADLPNAERHRPPVVPQKGTPAHRDAKDDLTHEIITTAFREFARTVRTYDDHRVLSTGNSRPRPSAWHQWKNGTWEIDSRKQFKERLLKDNPDPFDLISIHMYGTPERFGERLTVRQCLSLTNRITTNAGKPLFVGEFGVKGSGPKVKERFRTYVDAIEQSGVPLAALWVYDFGRHHNSEAWNVTFENDRSYQLRAIARANRRLRNNASVPEKKRKD